jgi:hypothetical protein
MSGGSRLHPLLTSDTHIKVTVTSELKLTSAAYYSRYIKNIIPQWLACLVSSNRQMFQNNLSEIKLTSIISNPSKSLPFPVSRKTFQSTQSKGRQHSP